MRASTYLTQLQASHCPSWPGGVAAAIRRRREATLMPQTGWWFRSMRIPWILSHHPASHAMVAPRNFLMCSAPLLATSNCPKYPRTSSRCVDSRMSYPPCSPSGCGFRTPEACWRIARSERAIASYYGFVLRENRTPKGARAWVSHQLCVPSDSENLGQMCLDRRGGCAFKKSRAAPSLARTGVPGQTSVCPYFEQPPRRFARHPSSRRGDGHVRLQTDSLTLVRRWSFLCSCYRLRRAQTAPTPVLSGMIL